MSISDAILNVKGGEADRFAGMNPQQVALAKVLRDEFFVVLNEGPLTPSMCSTLMRLAEAARDVLRARASKPEDFQNGTEHVGNADAPGLNVETFGVKMLKEVLPVLQAKLAPKAQADTTKLVEALAVARKEGLKDVEADLMVQLGLVPVGTVRAVGIGIEDDRVRDGVVAFPAPDGTLVDAEGYIVQVGHPQEGVLWASCQGADSSWRPPPEWKQVAP